MAQRRLSRPILPMPMKPAEMRSLAPRTLPVKICVVKAAVADVTAVLTNVRRFWSIAFSLLRDLVARAARPAEPRVIPAFPDPCGGRTHPCRVDTRVDTLFPHSQPYFFPASASALRAPPIVSVIA